LSTIGPKPAARLHRHGLYQFSRDGTRQAFPATSHPRRPEPASICGPAAFGIGLYSEPFVATPGPLLPRVVEGLELNQISETEAERRAELMANPRKIAKPTKAMPEQIDPNRLSKAIQYLKDHPRR
jgi:hypothetical protein